MARGRLGGLSLLSDIEFVSSYGVSKKKQESRQIRREQGKKQQLSLRGTTALLGAVGVMLSDTVEERYERKLWTIKTFKVHGLCGLYNSHT